MQRFDFVFYIGFVIIIALLSWKIGNLKNKISIYSSATNERSSTLQNHFFGKTVPEFSLPYVDSKGKLNFPKRKNSSYYLLIFFTPGDCYACFSEIPFWHELENKFINRLKVVGVSTANSRKMLQYFIKRNEISVPTLFDEEGLLFKELGLADSGMTPIKVLTTPKGVILHVKQTTHNNRKQQEKYLRVLDNLLP